MTRPMRGGSFVSHILKAYPVIIRFLDYLKYRRIGPIFKQFSVCIGYTFEWRTMADIRTMFSRPRKKPRPDDIADLRFDLSGCSGSADGTSTSDDCSTVSNSQLSLEEHSQGEPKDDLPEDAVADVDADNELQLISQVGETLLFNFI
jgi:hypothetical protein